jgi:uncharacterized membrane protein YsdA (DUF1294 family)/cold shock CspA family protein
MSNKGKIKSWNEQKAFGFIQPSEGGKDVFLHISGLANRNRTPAAGQTITYTLSTDKQGRPCAVNALLPGDRLSSPKIRGGIGGAIYTALAFFCFIAVITYAGILPTKILWGYLAFSLVTFFAYAFDKSAAKGGAWRTPENTLNGLSLVGGWPGALIAQQVLRHKTKKQSFRAVFWLTVFVNCGALLWFCTSDGAQLLQEWGI